MEILKNVKIKNAIMIGSLCSVAYLAVYITRNLLGAVTPQMVEQGVYTKEAIGEISALYFMLYAFGQLINGVIGDKVKARYMISFGLIFAGICVYVFPYANSLDTAKYIYGLSGFFLAMIFGPMTKVISENIEPVYIARCSLGYTFASFFGSPIAGWVAMLMLWDASFKFNSVVLLIMGAICFLTFLAFEKKGIVKYNQYNTQKKRGGGIKLLIKHSILRFTLISIVTGVIRTTVVFWLPTYINERLGFSSERAAGIFIIATLIISATPFIAIFVYEKLNCNVNLTTFSMFTVSAVLFLLTYLIPFPALNILFIIIAIMASNGAAKMIWSVYCPGLRDIGMVSSVTGYLDFVSYMAASFSSTIFANLVTKTGWGNIVLIWFALMVFGILISIPFKKRISNN